MISGQGPPASTPARHGTAESAVEQPGARGYAPTMNWKTLAFVVLVGFGLYQHLQQRPVVTSDGALAPSAPTQSNTQSGGFQFKGYQLQPLQDFAIDARVLSSETYRTGREADLSPVDLALGWGPMSDGAVLEKITISQSGRFYFWRAQELPIPRADIERASANMHMIPANDAIARQLKALKPGQTVRIEGWLVEVQASDGWRWRSSLTREDTGAGSCELVFVRGIQLL